MAKWVQKIRNLQIYAAALTLLLSGCSLKGNTQGNSSSEMNRIFSVISESSDNEIFKRTYHSSADYDRMILTLEEKGINNLSEEAKKAIESVSFYNSTPYDFSWVECFQIDDFYHAAYTHPNITRRVKEHSNTEFYDSIFHTITWDKLIERVVQNSNAYVKKEDNGNLSAVSVNDVRTILGQLENFTKGVQKDYPEYDLEHLACQLSALSLVYKEVPNPDITTLASTNYASIEWYLDDAGKKPVLETSIMLNEHEFKHFLCSYCQDEVRQKENVYITPSGLIYGANTSLNFSFIEEATAEEYAAERNGKPEVTYYEKREVLDTIRFVLSLQKDYEADGFLKYSLLQNPLGLIQQFPVLENQTYYFKNNLKMLASFNACLSALPYVFTQNVESISGYQKFYENTDKKKEVLSSLGTYAGVELSRLFLTNLVVMNDTESSMSLDYTFYLMRLFEKRMDNVFAAMSDYQKIVMSSANYKAIYKERLGAFFQYLSTKYQISLGNVRQLYEEYSINQAISYPSFVDEQRKTFYQEISQENYDSDFLREQSKTNLQYYIQYDRR